MTRIPTTPPTHAASRMQLVRSTVAGDRRGTRSAGSVPAVSIGLPVYNGERFLEEAMASLLAQDLTDLELIVADNASTDRTAEIVRGFQERDDRVRYLPAAHNHGAAWNFNRCVAAARAPYFKWAAHDDVYEPTYLSRCVEMLDAHPDLVLCHSKAVDIDETGAVLHEWTEPGAGTHADAVERFRLFLYQRSEFFEAFGLVRIEHLRATPLIRPYPSSDVPLMAELALHGRFGEVPEVLFRHREHPGRSVRVYSGQRGRTIWFDTRRGGGLAFPAWRMTYEAIRIAFRAPVDLRTRRRVLAVQRGWVWRRRGKLLREAIVGPLRRIEASPPKDRPGRAMVAGRRDDDVHSVLSQDGGERAAPSRVTIVVPTRDAETTLGETLRSLSAQTYSGVWDVLVLDRGSVERTRNLAMGWRSRLPGLQVLADRVDARSGFEQVAEASDAELFVVCASDLVVEPDWVVTLVQAALRADLAVAGSDGPTAVWSAASDEGVMPPWAVQPGFAVWRDIAVQLPADVESQSAAGAVARWRAAIDRGLDVLQVAEARPGRVRPQSLARRVIRQHSLGRHETTAGILVRPEEVGEPLEAAGSQAELVRHLERVARASGRLRARWSTLVRRERARPVQRFGS